MRLIDADELKKALAEMWYENNIRITGLSVAKLIDNAPTIEPSELDLDIDYSIEYDKRPDGISNAKVTITRIKPRNIIACEEVDELDMLERMYAEPSEQVTSKLKNRCNSLFREGSDDDKEQKSKLDLISRQLLIDAIEKCGEEKIYLQALIQTINALPSANRPQGEWVEVEDYNGDVHYQCDQCKEEYFLMYGTPQDNAYNYCPNCGAKMK